MPFFSPDFLVMVLAGAFVFLAGGSALCYAHPYVSFKTFVFLSVLLGVGVAVPVCSLYYGGFIPLPLPPSSSWSVNLLARVKEDKFQALLDYPDGPDEEGLVWQAWDIANGVMVFQDIGAYLGFEAPNKPLVPVPDGFKVILEDMVDPDEPSILFPLVAGAFAVGLVLGSMSCLFFLGVGAPPGMGGW